MIFSKRNKNSMIDFFVPNMPFPSEEQIKTGRDETGGLGTFVRGQSIKSESEEDLIRKSNKGNFIWLQEHMDKFVIRAISVFILYACFFGGNASPNLLKILLCFFNFYIFLIFFEYLSLKKKTR